MANITVRRNRGEPASLSQQQWDPFRVMREMMRWDPFREMAPVFGSEPGFAPAFDIKETKEGFVFRADLPGVKAEDVKVTMEGSRLQVSGRRETDHEEKTDTFYAVERSFGSFVRTFTLPQGADPKNAHADLSEGVLTITVGKAPESQPRQIAVQSAATKPKS